LIFEQLDSPNIKHTQYCLDDIVNTIGEAAFNAIVLAQGGVEHQEE
jgi:hypothetical protein